MDVLRASSAWVDLTGRSDWTKTRQPNRSRSGPRDEPPVAARRSRLVVGADHGRCPRARRDCAPRASRVDWAAGHNLGRRPTLPGTGSEGRVIAAAAQGGQVASLAPLTKWARGRLDDLVKVAFEQILERIEPYRSTDLVPAANLRRSVRSNMEFMLDAIADPGGTVDTSAPTQTGRERAHQGMPLPEVLGSYRISFAVLWDALVSHASARDARGADVSTGATGALLA